MNKQLTLLTISIFFATATLAMETKFNEQENNNATELKPAENLVKKLAQLHKELNVENLKKEFIAAQFPEKFSLYEKFITARLAKIAHVIEEDPREYCNLILVLRELLQTQPDTPTVQNQPVQQKQRLKAHPCPFIKEFTTITIKKPISIKRDWTALAFALSSDNKTLFAAGDENTIEIWDVSNPQKTTLIATIDESKNGHTDFVTSLTLSLDNKTLFSGAMDNFIKIWDVSDLHNPTLISPIKKHTDWPASLALSSDNNTLFQSDEKTVKIWTVSNLEKPTLIETLNKSNNGHAYPVLCVLLSTDNKTLFSGSNDKTLIWNVTNPTKPTFITSFDNANRDDAASSFALSSDNNIFFSGTENSIITLWNVSCLYKPTRIATFKASTDNPKRIHSLVLSSDNKTLFSGSRDDTIKIWNVSDPHNPTLIITLDQSKYGHKQSVRSLALSSDSSTLFSGSFDGTIKIWDWSQIFVPSLADYFTRLPKSSLGVLSYFFIKEIVNHKKHRRENGVTITKPLLITDPLLTQLFNELPKELQNAMLAKNYVTFTKLTYKPITNTTNNNNKNN